MRNSLSVPLLITSIFHWFILPSAAWNHNMFLVIVAAFAPMIILHFLRKRGSVPQSYLNEQERRLNGFKFVVTTVVTVIIFWNHWWLLILGLVIFFVIRHLRAAR